MAAPSIEDQIRERIEQFVDELTGLVRDSAMAAVGAALGESVASAPRRGAAPGRKPGRPASRKKRGRAARGGGAAKNASEVLAFVSANPGLRVDEVATALGADTKALQPAVKELLDAGSLRKEGQRRGTRYFAKGARGDGGAKAKTGSRKKRKASRKKKSARTTGARPQA